MKIGEKLTVPPKEFMKKFKRQDGTEFYSFFHNVSKKNKDTDQYEIIERYVIFVMNLILYADMEIEIEKIIETKPKLMIGNGGKEFLNNLVWIEAKEVVKEKQKETENYKVKDDDDNDMPLPF